MNCFCKAGKPTRLFSLWPTVTVAIVDLTLLQSNESVDKLTRRANVIKPLLTKLRLRPLNCTDQNPYERKVYNGVG